MFNIYRILFILLNILYNFISLVRQAWADLRRRYNAVELLFNLRKLNPFNETECILRCIKRIDKNRLPNHLVLILGREQTSLQDIVHIIAWCATAGIPFISFYDHDGILQQREGEARRQLAESVPQLVDYVYWNSTSPVKIIKNGSNGMKHKIQVQLLSYLDGKKKVVLLAQSLGKGVISGDLKAEEIVQELLENKLSLRGLPDPDLAVICGKTCSTYGLLPWHIRTTEFLQLDSHHNLQVEDFLSLLETYAKCEQRYGK